MKLLFVLAVAPSAVLMWYIWKKDTVEKEPFGLLAKLFGFGALTVISAIILELGAEALFGIILGDGVLYTLVENFIGVALIEELGKYVVLRKVTWKHPEFNYTFDAVVYAVAASLGFATVENIMYVFMNGVGTAVLRAVISVPGHCAFSVFMGYYYGRARRCHAYNDEKGARHFLRLALLVPTLLHGAFDFCLTMESGVFLLAFLILEICMTVVAIRKIRYLSRTAGPVEGLGLSWVDRI